jgi:hypothetical protein
VVLEHLGNGLRAAWIVQNGAITGAFGLGTMGLEWKIVGAGDFDSDQKEDILWENLSTGARAIWLMNGVGGVKAAVGLGVVSVEWRIAGAGDYNADGNDDILWQHTVTGVRAVWLMNGGGGVVSAPTLGVADPLWHMTAANDIDGDARDDIFLRHRTDGRILLWMMVGGQVVNAVSLGTMPADWQLAATGDIDGGGWDDAVWENTANGLRAAWLMGPGARVLSGPTLTVETPLWHIAAVLMPTVTYSLNVRLVWVPSYLYPGGNVWVSPFQGAYERGTTVTLTASPNNGWAFTGWTGGVVSSENPVTTTMIANRSVTASFELAPPSLTATAVNNDVTLSLAYEWPDGVDEYSYRTEVFIEESTTSSTTGYYPILSLRAEDFSSPITPMITRGPGTYYYRAIARGEVDAGGYSDISTPYSPVKTISIAGWVGFTLFAGMDALVSSSSDPAVGNTNFIDSDLAVGCKYTVSGMLGSHECSYALVKFDDLEYRLNGVYVTRAILRMTPLSLAADRSRNYAVNAIASDWGQNVTFNTRPTIYSTPQPEVAPPGSLTAPLELDVTALVQLWLDGSRVNYGLWIHEVTGAFPSSSVDRTTRFWSRSWDFWYWYLARYRPSLYLEVAPLPN